MNRVPGARAKKGFCGYTPELEKDIFEFQRAEYPQRDPRQGAAAWRWMFLDSAARLGRQPSVWLYRKAGAIVAHQGAIPVRLRVAGEEIPTGWFVETMAAKSVRGSPIGPMLIRKALEDMPTNLSLGQTEQMRQIQLAMGWKHVCWLTKHLLVCGYRMNLRNKLPPIVAEAAALGLGVWHGLRWRRAPGARAMQADFRMIDRFGERHDELWNRMAVTCTCAVVRDASYMNWKYIDRPAGNFRCMEMFDGGGLQGIVVVMLAEPNDVYRYRRGFLVDFVVPLDRDDIVSRLIHEGVSVLKREGAQTIICQTASATLRRAVARLGFVPREPRHQLLVAAEHDLRSKAREFFDAESWFLTLGDSDADAYAD